MFILVQADDEDVSLKSIVCSIEVWQILVQVGLQDLPFLVIHLTVMLNYQVGAASGHGGRVFFYIIALFAGLGGGGGGGKYQADYALISKWINCLHPKRS